MAWRFLTSVVLVLGFFVNRSLAQCTVTASVLNDVSVCGDCIQLSAFGQGQGQIVFQENFNSGAPTGWAFTQQAQFNNPCSPGGVNGTKHIWMGSTSAVPRSLETQPYNFSTASSGATICFDMLFATQGNSAPCEGPDEPQEGVYLQYRVGSGAWTTIHYFDPNGGNDPQLVNWNNWCFTLPPAATTANVSIRWFQDNDSGADYDHWGIDNVQIYFNDPTYQITWPHNGFSYPVGSSGGVNPTATCPRVTTDYIVVMTNGSSTCRDTVRVNVVSPTIEVDAGNDTTICAGECATLNGTSKVIKSPRKTPTYSNSELIPIPTVFGTTGTININVTGLNMTNVLPNSITSVCIQSLTFFGFNFFPPGQLTIGDLNLKLICPDGTKLTLVPSGTTTSTQGIQGYTNTCFTLASTNDIANAAPPYSGSYMPEQPFSNLAGCTANGVWAIEVSPASSLGFGVGTFFGWNITFDDPEISYPADFTWTPTTNMTNSTTLAPTVCPPASQQYILTANDSAGCVTERDTVSVTVQPVCCNLQFSATSSAPACGATDGSITVNIFSGSGNYSYLWSNGATSLSLTSVPAGTYTLTVTDLTYPDCDRDTTISLSNFGAPVITNITSTNESCLDSLDGTATVVASGGTGVLIYEWNNGETTTTITGLGGGNYSVTVTDANQCETSAAVSVQAGPICCALNSTVTTVAASCSGADGSLTVHVVVSSGNAPFTYTIDGIIYGSDSVFTDLAGGIYKAVVRDVNLCADTTEVTVVSPPNTITTSIASTDVTCFGDSDGTATANAAGGNAPLSIVWSNNNETTDAIMDLAPGDYYVTVTDQINCVLVDTVTVGEPVQLLIDIGGDQSVCVGDTAAFTVPGSFAQILWSNNETTPTVFFTQPGAVSVEATDADGCTATDNANVVVNNPPTVDAGLDTTIYDFESVTLNPAVNAAVNAAGFIWSPSTELSCDNCENPIASPDSSILYYVTYNDANGCEAFDSVFITVLDGDFFAIVPNAFTPNGDGNNDVLYVYHKGLDRLVFRIYNRWGSMIYETENPTTGWDGTFKGKELNPDVYVYELYAEFINNTVKRTTRSVMLLK